MAGGACGGTIVDGPMPPRVVGGMVWVAGAFPPCMVVGAMWVISALPPCVVGGIMCAEGPLPPCVTIGPAWLVTMGGGNGIMIVCMTVLGPLSRLWVIVVMWTWVHLLRLGRKMDSGLQYPPG